MQIRSKIIKNSDINFGTSGARGLVTDCTAEANAVLSWHVGF